MPTATSPISAQRRCRLVRVVAVVCRIAVVAVAATGGAAAAAGGKTAAPKVAPVEGPPVELVREMIKSLDASYVEKVQLDRYAVMGLDAIADMDRCLTRQIQPSTPGTITLVCGPSTFTASWPPRNSDEVAALLSNAIRLVDPEHEVRTERERAVARGLTRAVDDPFTAYLPPELVALVTSRMFDATPGVEVWPRDPTKVREVRRTSDAARAGVEPGDRILSIDDANVLGLTFPEIAAKLQGANDSYVSLKLKTSQGEKPFRLARSIVPERDITHNELERSVLYIQLPVFKQGIADRIKGLLWDVRPAGVVLDLRHNGGGFVPEATQLADLFLKDGTIAGTRSGPGRPTEDYAAKRDSNDMDCPLVLLVDGGTASASELFAMSLKERKRAVVIGTQTAGKGSFQRQIHMPDGGILKVTAGFYVGPGGGRLGENGVTPDRFLAPAAQKTVLEGGDPRRDSWILSALDALQGQRPAHGVTYAGAGPAP